MKLKEWILDIILSLLGEMVKLDYGNKLNRIKDNLIGIVFLEEMDIKEKRY